MSYNWFHLTPDQQAVLEAAAAQSDDPLLQQRAAALCLTSRGNDPALVARACGIPHMVLRIWHHDFCQKGLVGLAASPADPTAYYKALAALIPLVLKALRQNARQSRPSFARRVLAGLRRTVRRVTSHPGRFHPG